MLARYRFHRANADIVRRLFNAHRRAKRRAFLDAAHAFGG